MVGEKTKYLEYSPPADVKALMREWLRRFNAFRDKAQRQKKMRSTPTPGRIWSLCGFTPSLTETAALRVCWQTCPF